MGRLSRLILWATVATAMGAASADAQTGQTYRYRITHSSFGEIGTYTNTVSQSGDLTQVETQLRIAVKLLGLVVYREEADRTEQWRGDRLMAFKGVTAVNGDKLEVRGEAHGDQFVIKSPSGVQTAPGTVVSSNPWPGKQFKTNLMMSTKTGQLDKIDVSGGHDTIITIGGLTMPVRHYVIQSDKRQEVWVDERGVPVRFRSEEADGPVDFTLATSPTKLAR